MTYNPETHHRRSIRLVDHDYSQSGTYYFTLATHEKAHLFGEITAGMMHLSEMGRIADEHWRAVPQHFPNVILGVHVVMPNHIHGIIVIQHNVGAVSVGASHEDAQAGTTTGFQSNTAAYTNTENPSNAHSSIANSIPTRASRWDAPTDAPILNGPKRGSLGAIIGVYKMSVTRRIQRELGCSGIWQRNYYEHIIRSDEDYLRIHEYIEANPANWTADENYPTNR